MDKQPPKTETVALPSESPPSQHSPADKYREDPEDLITEDDMVIWATEDEAEDEAWLNGEIESRTPYTKNGITAEVIDAWNDCMGTDAWYDSTGRIDPAVIDETYCGQWDSDEAFARDLLTNDGYLPSNLHPFIDIDWEATAKKVMMEYFESNGHYFRVYFPA
jgi:hypothetical protein